MPGYREPGIANRTPPTESQPPKVTRQSHQTVTPDPAIPLLRNGPHRAGRIGRAPWGTEDRPPVLEITHLTRRFGAATAVANVSLRIRAGEMIGIVGRSGAGKSTLLRLINRTIEPSGGAIAANGSDILALRGKALRQWRSRTAMIFQQFNLVHRLDVLTNVLCGGLHGMPTHRMLLKLFTEQERVRAIRALDRVGLADFATNRADALSGGQQQRVAIARALMQTPHMILADEPIASLDPMNAKTVMDSLAAINRDEGIAVLCNLHTIDTARAYCHRILGMAAGRIVFDGTPDQLTGAVLAGIYGAANGLDERMTSTSLPEAAMPEAGMPEAGMPEAAMPALATT